jgi:hypothetical protein
MVWAGIEMLEATTGGFCAGRSFVIGHQCLSGDFKLHIKTFFSSFRSGLLFFRSFTATYDHCRK